MPRGNNASSQGKGNRKKQQAARSTAPAAPASNASTTTLVQQQPKPYVLNQDTKSLSSEEAPGSTAQVPPSKKQLSTKGTPASSIQKPAPNVFEYLDEDDSSDSDSDSDSDNDPEPPQKRKANPPPPLRNVSTVKTSSDRPEPKTSRQSSFNSDTGISLRGTSSDRASSVASRESADDQPATPPNATLSPIAWKFGTHAMFSPQIIGAYNSYAPSLLDEENSDTGDPFDISVPETFYIPSRERAASSPSSPISPRDRPRKDSIRSRTSQPNRESPRMASRRKSSTAQSNEARVVPPVYRKFEALNHRVLLNLQNEIAQMEEDLKRLDELEAVHRTASARRSPGLRKLSTSNHHDVESPSLSTLHSQKQELLEQVQSKLQQYNRALCSYSKVVQTFPHASHQDIETYRTWIQERSPASKAESRYLDHDYDPDLVSLSLRPALKWTTAPIHTTITAISIAILLPLLAFGTISEFFGRLVLVSIVGGAASFFANSGPPGVEHFINPQDGWKCAAFYFGFMTISAMIIP